MVTNNYSGNLSGKLERNSLHITARFTGFTTYSHFYLIEFVYFTNNNYNIIKTDSNSTNLILLSYVFITNSKRP